MLLDAIWDRVVSTFLNVVLQEVVVSASSSAVILLPCFLWHVVDGFACILFCLGVRWSSGVVFTSHVLSWEHPVETVVGRYELWRHAFQPRLSSYLNLRHTMAAKKFHEQLFERLRHNPSHQVAVEVHAGEICVIVCIERTLPGENAFQLV